MKLVIASLVSLGLAAPAVACPNMDHSAATAKKTEEKAPEKTTDKAKDAPKQKEQPKDDTAKSKDGAKKPDKVSSK